MSIELDPNARAFLETQHSAAMTTLRRDGTPHSVRIGVALVDGKIWSSGTQARARTKHLRRDPRASLFVFDAGFRFLTLECRVHILDGAGAPQQNLRLFQVMQAGMSPAPAPGTITWYGKSLTYEAFLQAMKDEDRLVYEFVPLRAYGLYGEAPSR
jgi:PPOX class probable F420-dependent enzyme